MESELNSVIVQVTALSLSQILKVKVALSYGTSKFSLTCPHVIGNC